MTKNSAFFQIAKLAALTLILSFLIIGYITLLSKRAAGIRPEPEATVAVLSPTIAPPTAALTPTSSATFTASPTITPPPTHTKTATLTAGPTVTLAPTQTAAPVEVPPTFTLTPSPALTPTVAATVSSTAITPVEVTFTPTVTPTNTPSGPPTDTPTPTVTPTPVPRTVQADDTPDYTQAAPHFWFTRPYTAGHKTQGSWYYPYGTNNNGQYLWHRGLDIQNPQGTPIQAVGDGLVVFAGDDLARAIGPETNFYGRAIIIQHSNAWAVSDNPEEDLRVFTLYGHVEQVLVQEGESVVAGQPIALTGQRGVALGPHLHLEVRIGENAYLNTQNPDLWVRSDEGYGVIAGRVVDINNFYVPQQFITLHRAGTPARFWRQTWTYPDHRYTFDPQLGETFTFADVPAGDYIVKTTFDGRNYSLPVTVQEQDVSFVLIKGRSAPSPTATSEATPEATPTTKP